MSLAKIIFSHFGHWALLAVLSTGVYAQEEDTGSVGGGGYFIYQCPSFDESVAKLSVEARETLRDMCTGDSDVKDCVHEFFNLPDGCKMKISPDFFRRPRARSAAIVKCRPACAGVQK